MIREGYFVISLGGVKRMVLKGGRDFRSVDGDKSMAAKGICSIKVGG